MTEDTLLELISICKKYGKVKALEDVRLIIKKGKVLSLLGENGAGKSTLVSILGGIIQPDSGVIVLNSNKAEFSSPAQALKAGIGVIYQESKLVDSLTVAENIFLRAPFSFFLRKSKILSQALSLSEKYGFDLDPTQHVSELSIGEKQQLEIISLLQKNCQLFIFDEATSLLTPGETEAFFKTIKKIVEDNNSVIFISHKLDDVMKVADQVVIMRRGLVTRCFEREDVQSAEFLSLQMFEHGVIQKSKSSPVKHGQTILKISNLSAKILNSVNLHVRKGEIVAVVGGSGNGRKELVNILTGELEPKEGEVSILGEDWAAFFSQQYWNQSLSHIPEDTRLRASCGDLDLIDNLLLTTKEVFVKGGMVQREKVKVALEKLLKDFDITATGPEALASTLSGGNLQKFIIARTFLSEPKLMIVEQPTQGLDVKATEEIWQLLLECREQVGVLLFTSNFSEAINLADRVVLLKKGKVAKVCKSGDRQGMAILFQEMVEGQK